MMQKSITYKEFQTDDATAASKLIDYYEGDQERYVTQMLNGQMNGFGKREDWQERGYVPRSRNIIKSIIDKSGLLFNKPPVLSIIPLGQTRTITDQTFDRIMHDSDYLEFFQNVDVYTRLMKSTIVLQQKYIPTEVATVNGQYMFDATRGDALLLILLHRGNSVVRMDITNTKIIELAYLIPNTNDGDADSQEDQGDVWYYRVITPNSTADYMVKDDKEFLVSGSEQPNQDGFVPANFFYDINKPRAGAWVDSPEDIISFQEIYNLHLTDTEFAAAWQKQKTLFTDSAIIDTTQVGTMEGMYAGQGHTDGGTVYAPNQTKKSLGGLGRIVSLQPGQGDKAPFIKFDGPDTNLAELDTMMRALVKDIAFDWDVTINSGAEVRASSGFQIVVEEMNNLNLREKRGQSFRAGFRRFYNLTQKLYPELTVGTLWADFAAPSIPVNTMEQEQMWQMRLDGNRSSLVDYFMETQEMTEQEANDKIQAIIEEKKMLAKELPQPIPQNTTPASNVPTPADTANRGNTSPSSTTG
jgi:hypothetical protein